MSLSISFNCVGLVAGELWGKGRSTNRDRVMSRDRLFFFFVYTKEAAASGCAIPAQVRGMLREKN